MDRVRRRWLGGAMLSRTAPEIAQNSDPQLLAVSGEMTAQPDEPSTRERAGRRWRYYVSCRPSCGSQTRAGSIAPGAGPALISESQGRRGVAPRPNPAFQSDRTGMPLHQPKASGQRAPVPTDSAQRRRPDRRRCPLTAPPIVARRPAVSSTTISENRLAEDGAVTIQKSHPDHPLDAAVRSIGAARIIQGPRANDPCAMGPMRAERALSPHENDAHARAHPFGVDELTTNPPTKHIESSRRRAKAKPKRWIPPTISLRFSFWAPPSSKPGDRPRVDLPRPALGSSRLRDPSMAC